MNIGNYLVQVFVKDNLVPFYQYANKNHATVNVCIYLNSNPFYSDP